MTDPQKPRPIPSLDKGDIRFFDNIVPTLEVGDYLINVTQQVNPMGTTIDECYGTSQPFSVQGPRYTLPTGDVFSVYPPNNSQGVFEKFMPNVVLTQRDLPWERNVFEDADKTQQTPWLALLLFVEGETLEGQPTLLDIDPAITTQKFKPTQSFTLSAYEVLNHANDPTILWPALQREWYESDDFLKSTQCTMIDISPTAFTQLIPAHDDLRYLAHVRQVNPSAKDKEVLKVSGSGWFSVILGNRLPDAPTSKSSFKSSRSAKPGRRNIVHLVSLEGFEDYVTGKATIPQGVERIRMISMRGWSFTCLPERGESFSALMNGLLIDDEGHPKSTSWVLPIKPPTSSSPQETFTVQTLQNGYAPLRYQTRLGEQTFAWYRGPFSPIPVKNFVRKQSDGNQGEVGWKPFNTASAAIIYNPEYGLFDVSYGVAWETGRLLALADGSFGTNLLEWQRKGHQLIDLILERRSQVKVLNKLNPNDPDAATEKDLFQQIEPYAVTKPFINYLVAELGRQLTPHLAAPTPSSGEPPLPPYPDLPPAPTDPHTIAELLKRPEIQHVIRQVGGQGLESIVDRLARWYLLDGVPFENIVPNADLLPPESIRFFYIDTNWLDALMEGALSIGISSSRDQLYRDLMKTVIWDNTTEAMQQLRDELLGGSPSQPPSPEIKKLEALSLSGLLLRSAVVSGWPGLEVNGYSQPFQHDPEKDQTNRIKLLRMERLSADVLLCLWPTVPASVTIDEPREGITFGFEDPPSDQDQGNYLYLRSVEEGSFGQPLSGSQYAINVDQGILDAHRRVKLSGEGGLLQTMQNKLPNQPQLSIYDFAVEMLKVPEQAVFNPPSSKEAP